MQLTLRQLRVGAKLTQAQVAKALGIHTTQYGAVENLDAKMLSKLAKLYDVKPEDIKVVS